MEERGIKEAEELAAAMHAEENGWSYVYCRDQTWVVLEDPGSMNPVFTVIAGDALSPDEEQSRERGMALLEAATEDVGSRVRARARKNRARLSDG